MFKWVQLVNVGEHFSSSSAHPNGFVIGAVCASRDDVIVRAKLIPEISFCSLFPNTTRCVWTF